MKRFFTRRQLAKAAVAGTALAPLGHSDATVPKPEFDPVHWTLESYKSAPLKLTFSATSKSQAEAWQRSLKAKLIELVGGFPDVRAPLQFQSVETRKFPEYLRETFVFTSRPGVAVSGYLLTPFNVKPRFAPVICIPGHGYGVDDIVGIDEHGADRTTKAGYQHDFAIQVVEHGLAAVAIEPMGFGCRRDAANMQKGPNQTSCQPSAGAALLFGETMIGWRVWDVMRTIDWIATRPELDGNRIGCLGISGGGECTQFAAALDTRIKAAFISGYLNTYRDSIMSISHCIDNYVPGILNWAESYDVAGLIAPRFLFSEGGDKDPIFPIAATRASFAKVQKVYEVFGAPDHARQEIFSGDHSFYGKEGLPFLSAALKGENTK
jgi:dienelactone hydrolase